MTKYTTSRSTDELKYIVWRNITDLIEIFLKVVYTKKTLCLKIKYYIFIHSITKLCIALKKKHQLSKVCKGILSGKRNAPLKNIWYVRVRKVNLIKILGNIYI